MAARMKIFYSETHGNQDRHVLPPIFAQSYTYWSLHVSKNVFSDTWDDLDTCLKNRTVSHVWAMTRGTPNFVQWHTCQPTRPTVNKSLQWPTCLNGHVSVKTFYTATSTKLATCQNTFFNGQRVPLYTCDTTFSTVSPLSNWTGVTTDFVQFDSC